MPIRNAWHSLNRDEVNNVPEKAGVYELGNANYSVIYIGRASGGNLRRRLGEHINDQKNACIRASARYFRYETTMADVSRERELIEEYRATHGGRLPPCNSVIP